MLLCSIRVCGSSCCCKSAVHSGFCYCMLIFPVLSRHHLGHCRLLFAQFYRRCFSMKNCRSLDGWDAGYASYVHSFPFFIPSPPISKSVVPKLKDWRLQLGSVIIALNGPKEETLGQIRDFQKLFLAPGFLAYTGVLIAISLGIVFYFAPRFVFSIYLFFVMCDECLKQVWKEEYDVVYLCVQHDWRAERQRYDWIRFGDRHDGDGRQPGMCLSVVLSCYCVCVGCFRRLMWLCAPCSSSIGLCIS